MEHPLVSWLMPMYNDGVMAKKAIDSMLAQTYQHFEIIIVLDPSDEETNLVCKEYEKKDNRMRIIRNEKRLGIPESLNTGLKYCLGKYIARMDSDDYSYPDRLEKQVQYLEEHPEVGLLGGNARYVVENAEESHVAYQEIPNSEEIRVKLLFYNCIIHPSIMFRANISEIKYPNRIGEDYALYTQLISKVKIEIIPEVVLDYTLRKESAGHSIPDLVRIYSAKISKEVIWRELGIETKEYPDSLFGVRENTEIENAEEFLNCHLKLAQELIQANERCKIFDSAPLLEVLNEQWLLSLWMIRQDYYLPSLEQSIEQITSEKIEIAFRTKKRNQELPSKVVVYGTGWFCQRIIEKKGKKFLDKVICFCDSNLEKHGREYFGKRIISPDQLGEVLYDAVVIASPKYGKEIEETLLLSGINQERIIIL